MSLLSKELEPSAAVASALGNVFVALIDTAALPKKAQTIAPTLAYSSFECRPNRTSFSPTTCGE